MIHKQQRGTKTKKSKRTQKKVYHSLSVCFRSSSQSSPCASKLSQASRTRWCFSFNFFPVCCMWLLPFNLLRLQVTWFCNQPLSVCSPPTHYINIICYIWKKKKNARSNYSYKIINREQLKNKCGMVPVYQKHAFYVARQRGSPVPCFKLFFLYCFEPW